jgi:Heterokaryon incompatibility protein (HET)
LNVSLHVSHHDRNGIHPIIPVTTNGERECYCALSYCWDPKSPRDSQTTLLTTMIDQFRQSLPVKELPIPIKEAVEVIRRIGVSYLWVDWLCICQNDEKYVATSAVSVVVAVSIAVAVSPTLTLSVDVAVAMIADVSMSVDVDMSVDVTVAVAVASSIVVAVAVAVPASLVTRVTMDVDASVDVTWLTYLLG